MLSVCFQQVKYARVDTHPRLCMKVKEFLCKTHINCPSVSKINELLMFFMTNILFHSSDDWELRMKENIRLD